MADEQERSRHGVQEFRVEVRHSFDRVALSLLRDIVTGLTSNGIQLTRLEEMLKRMTTEMRAAWLEIDAETTRIADAMEAALKDDPEALAKVQAHLTAMKAIGANPENPMPDARGR